MTPREWQVKTHPHIHGTIEDCIQGRDRRICEGCGATEEEISVPDKMNPRVPYWPGFLSFLMNHENCCRVVYLTSKGKPDKRRRAEVV